MSAHLIIDFDSTLVSVETLDVLAEISLKESSEKLSRLKTIHHLTSLGMEGKLSIKDSLTERIKLLNANKSHIPGLVREIKKRISPSFLRNRKALAASNKNIYIVSSGFKEVIDPIITSLGLLSKNVFANTLRFDASGTIIGVDTKNPLAHPYGKVKIVEKLSLKGKTIVIGDGSTDAEIVEKGKAETFYYFAENILRKSVAERAHKVVYSIDEVLFEEKLPTKYSYPPSKMKILLLENIDKEAALKLKKQGYLVESLTNPLSEDELVQRIQDVSFLGVRSRTRVTAKVLHAGKKLLGVGVFSVGTDKVDVKEAEKLGIAVFNAPFSNTRSVVELAIGEMIVLLRRAIGKGYQAKCGVWNKSVEGAREIRGKKLGIIGYGNIGSQLSVLAESLGLEVHYYDIVEKLSLGNAKRQKSLKDLLKISDIISVHMDGRGSNTHLIGEKEFKLMKDGVIFLNLGRASVVDYEALEQAIASKKIAGAGIDVFMKEPSSNDEPFTSPLAKYDNVLLTPHIAGSTVEAQASIGAYVAERILRYISLGETFGCLTLPQINVETAKKYRFLHIHENVPGILAAVNGILGKHKINIVSQSLKTKDAVGYLITDTNGKVSDKVLKDLRAVPHTVKLRVIQG